ncbi:MAG: hypothetical protein ACHP65_09595 [Legionellales bacterium]
MRYAKIPEAFRRFLRDIGSKNLEIILYKNSTDVISAIPKEKTMPSDQDIESAFKKINAEYKYVKLIPNELLAFIKFFKLCKITADYIECNNSPDHSNEVAYLHAYKLLVLLGAGQNLQEFLKIERFFEQHQHSLKKNPKPVHDLLVNPIPVNDPAMTEAQLTAWQKLIRERGPEALSWFQRAGAINKSLNEKLPTNDSIKTALTQLSYLCANENLVLAGLCLQYHVEEAIFNKCLAITPKERDKLPKLIIDGARLKDAQHPQNNNYPGYYIVKLPVNDPRAYILGKITNCCQSIGGHGETCVIDGITKENNGFYVLLKAKKLTDIGKSPFIDEEINYEAFDIMGQGYAWISQNDNLTFDSWENLTPKAHDAIADSMLRKFAETATADAQYPNVVQVTIGHGGKTPLSLIPDNAQYLEKIKGGRFYGDALYQSTLSINEARLEVLRKRFIDVCNAFKIQGYQALGSVLLDNTQDIYPSSAVCKILRSLLLDDNNLSLLAMLEKSPSRLSCCLNLLVMLDNSNLLTPQILTMVVKHQDCQLIANGLEMLVQKKLLTGANFDAVAKHQSPGSVAYALGILDKNELLTGANRDAVATSQDPGSVAITLVILAQHELLTGDNAQANRDAVVNQEDPKLVVQALEILAQHKLLTGNNAQTNCYAVVTHPNPKSAADALEILAHNHLLTGANRDAVVKHQNPWSVASALELLAQNNLLTGNSAQANRDAVTKHQYPRHVARTLVMFDKNKLLTGGSAQVNRDAVAEHQNPWSLAIALIILDKNKLLTGDGAQANRDAVAKHQDPKLHAQIIVVQQRIARQAEIDTKKSVDDVSAASPSVPAATTVSESPQASNASNNMTFFTKSGSSATHVPAADNLKTNDDVNKPKR